MYVDDPREKINHDFALKQQNIRKYFSSNTSPWRWKYYNNIQHIYLCARVNDVVDVDVGTTMHVDIV